MSVEGGADFQERRFLHLRGQRLARDEVKPVLAADIIAHQYLAIARVAKHDLGFQSGLFQLEPLGRHVGVYNKDAEFMSSTNADRIAIEFPIEPRVANIIEYANGKALDHPRYINTDLDRICRHVRHMQEVRDIFPIARAVQVVRRKKG